jgi:hypothetical protein
LRSWSGPVETDFQGRLRFSYANGPGDHSLESLRQLYDLDTADPDLGIINVTGLKCVGVPIGTPEFVDAFVRSKVDDIQQDVQKLRIIQDPKIHYDLLRFCQHTRIAFLARNVPPDVMMKNTTDNPAAPILVQDAIVQAILQRGLGDTYNTLPARFGMVSHDSRIAPPRGRTGHHASSSFWHVSFLQCHR